jgi:hypothetical protein
MSARLTSRSIVLQPHPSPESQTGRAYNKAVDQINGDLSKELDRAGFLCRLLCVGVRLYGRVVGKWTCTLCLDGHLLKPY